MSTKFLRRAIALVMLPMLLCMPSKPASAAAPLAVLEVIKAGIKKVIKAVDLKVQRLQNKTIWLQNAQKAVENTLSKMKLTQISEWSEKQRSQYGQYFQELQRVKTVILYHQRIRGITQKQLLIVKTYQNAWKQLNRGAGFSPGELEYMARVYGGLLKRSSQDIDALAMVVKSFRTQMSDAQRLEMIDRLAKRVDGNFAALMAFNNGNTLLNIKRSREARQGERLKLIYGLP